MNSATLMSLALRNLSRHLRRTVLTCASVALSAGLLYFSFGFFRGTHQEMMQESFIRFKTNHIVVRTQGFSEREPDTWVDSQSLFTGHDSLAAWLLTRPQTKAVSVRLIDPGFVGNGRERYPVMVTGVDPAHERDAGMVAQSIVAGAYLDSTDGLLMGQALADLFGLKLGDAVYVQAQTTHGTPNLEVLTLSGIYHTGFLELDRNTVFVRLATAQRLFDTPGAANRMLVLLKQARMTEAVLGEVRAKVHAGLSIEPWQTFARALLEDAKGDRLFFNVLVAILLLISVSSIGSTMSMSVIERTSEIGTLRATGWERGDIVRLFLTESLCIGAVGALAGLVLFVPVSIYMAVVGIDLSRMGETMAIPVFRMICRPEWRDALISVVVGIAATFAGGLLPSIRAGRLRIVDCLKHT